MSNFDAEVLLALRGARTVRIETSAAAGLVDEVLPTTLELKPA